MVARKRRTVLLRDGECARPDDAIYAKSALVSMLNSQRCGTRVLVLQDEHALHHSRKCSLYVSNATGWEEILQDWNTPFFSIVCCSARPSGHEVNRSCNARGRGGMAGEGSLILLHPGDRVAARSVCCPCKPHPRAGGWIRCSSMAI